MLNERTASHLIDVAAEAIRNFPQDFHELLDALPAAIYATDGAGTLTYFNKVCVELAGRTPQTGTDKWCVTRKIFTTEGERLPHDECPMAIALREGRSIRDVEAIAERPDGTRVNFIPYPTPLFDVDGKLAGAVSLLLDVTEQRTPEFLTAQAARCRRLAAAMTDEGLAQTLSLLAAEYDEQARKPVH
jgi:PAS domain S-box-containing protein